MNKADIEIACKGCQLHDDTGFECAYKEYSIVKHCPCTDCLIKVLCDKQKCDLRTEEFYKIVDIQVIEWENER